MFRLLYPHFSPRRRYDMQESSLARKLVSIWRLGGSNKDRIERWNEAAHVERGQLGRSGCLGLEVKRVAETLVSAEMDGGCCYKLKVDAERISRKPSFDTRC